MQRPQGKNEWVAGTDYSQPNLGMRANSRQLESRWTRVRTRLFTLSKVRSYWKV